MAQQLQQASTAASSGQQLVGSGGQPAASAIGGGSSSGERAIPPSPPELRPGHHPVIREGITPVERAKEVARAKERQQCTANQREMYDYDSNEGLAIDDILFDYSNSYSERQLLMPWHLEKRVIELHPQAQPGDQQFEHARDCTMTISGIPEDMPEEKLFEGIITLGGRLPVGNHEVIATHLVLNRRTGEQWAYLRWSSKEYADQAKKFSLRAGRPNQPFRILNEHNKRPNHGQQRLYRWVWEKFSKYTFQG